MPLSTIQCDQPTYPPTSNDTSSLQVLCSVTADCVITVSLILFSFDGSVKNALFPPGLPTSHDSLGAMLADVACFLLIRSALSLASVTGVTTLTLPIGLAFTALLQSLMCLWMVTKAVLAAHAINDGLDIQIPGSLAKIHLWWLYIALVMSGVFGWFEYSLCVAWRQSFRQDRTSRRLELRDYSFRRPSDSQWFRQYYIQDQSHEDLTAEPLLESVSQPTS